MTCKFTRAFGLNRCWLFITEVLQFIGILNPIIWIWLSNPARRSRRNITTSGQAWTCWFGFCIYIYIMYYNIIRWQSWHIPWNWWNCKSQKVTSVALKLKHLKTQTEFIKLGVYIYIYIYIFMDYESMSLWPYDYWPWLSSPLINNKSLPSIKISMQKWLILFVG